MGSYLSRCIHFNNHSIVEARSLEASTEQLQKLAVDLQNRDVEMAKMRESMKQCKSMTVCVDLYSLTDSIASRWISSAWIRETTEI
jgi:hypothetical protein